MIETVLIDYLKGKERTRLGEVTTVDSTGDVGQYTSITMGSDSLLVISYYDVTNGDLKVAKCYNLE